MTNQPLLQNCQLQIDDAVAVLHFDRDDVMNALTGTTIVDDIVLLVDWLNQQNSVHVLVITGKGRAFSAGGNVKDMFDRTNDFAGDAEQLVENYKTGIQRLPLALSRLEIPTIAAVNGAAVGAGFDIINMCDLAIASTRAKMGETFINIGIIPGDGGAWFLPRKIGLQKATELTLTGRIIKAEEALELGLILEITDPDTLLPTALKLAKNIASKPSFALRQAKRLLQGSATMELKPFLDLCAETQAQCHQQDEHVQALKLLLEKMQAKK